MQARPSSTLRSSWGGCTARRRPTLLSLLRAWNVGAHDPVEIPPLHRALKLARLLDFFSNSKPAYTWYLSRDLTANTWYKSPCTSFHAYARAEAYERVPHKA